MGGISDYLLGDGVPFEDVEDFIKRIFKAPKYLSTLQGAGKPGKND